MIERMIDLGDCVVAILRGNSFLCKLSQLRIADSPVGQIEYFRKRQGDEVKSHYPIRQPSK